MKSEPGQGGALPPWNSTTAGGAALGAVAALALWQAHYHSNVAVPPRLWVADGPLRERVLPHCSALLRPFAPTPWAANKHAQTVLGLLRTLTMRNHYNRQLILTVDGATLGLDWFDGCDAPSYRAPTSAAAHSHRPRHASSGGGGGEHPPQAPTVQSVDSAKGSSFTSNRVGSSPAGAVAPAVAPAAASAGAPAPPARTITTSTPPAATASAHTASMSMHASACSSCPSNSSPSLSNSPSPQPGGGGALPATAPILLVCHGINGGSHEGYAKWVCAAAVARGWRAVVLNYRGCNGLPFTAPRGYAATLSHDVYTAVYSVRARFPGAPLFAVGYSLGGLKLTKYLGEADAGLHVPPPGAPRLFAGSGLEAAAVVSSPVSLWHSSANLADRSSVNFMYNLAVAYKLREHLAHHKEQIQALTRFDVDSALAAWTVGEIEDRGLPASFGFSSRQHYYEVAGSLDYIPAITTPTLILLAEDDPFLGVIPDAECSRNPNTLLAVTRRGGHVAFLQGAWPLGRAYMDDAVTEFFDATLKHLHDTPHSKHAQAGAGAGTARAGVEAAGGRQQGGTARTGTAAAALPVVAVSDAARAAATAGAVAAAARSCATPSCCSDAAWRSPGAAAAEGPAGNDATSRAKAAVLAAAEAAKRAETEAATLARKAEAAGRAAAQVRLLMHLQQQQEEQRLLRAMMSADATDGGEQTQPKRAVTQDRDIRSRL
ncbi:hypothetical protein HYH02_012649 [Chlamydomonas schloesseri]|uniref:AB hydrolase-1 domain-containing protein n=1 Tax=Chlamydomonas schloesseri TaxID=2026947 RepID=A0A835SXE8_9CHLO|nr:hypothetical protein HYH02_012649 [Chlamydomonas schloesseri]|eukprot:KAG2433531.1 hypothetical protein HYH02_012649 [Chlamydomonas schloesseri]